MGFGFIYLPAIVIVSQYFENKRALATGIAGSIKFFFIVKLRTFSVAGSGFGTCVLPVLSKFLIEGIKLFLFFIILIFETPHSQDMDGKCPFWYSLQWCCWPALAVACFSDHFLLLHLTKKLKSKGRKWKKRKSNGIFLRC